MSVVSSPQLMRQANALHVLRALRSSGPLGRTEIARLSGLSKPTVNNIVGELLDRRYFHEHEPASSGAQRPGPQANLLSFNPAIGHVIGFDLGVSRLRAGLSDLDGNILHLTETSLAGGLPDLAAFADLATGLAHTLLDRASLPVGALWAAGMGLPGFVDRRSGELLLAPGLEAWAGQSFADTMADAFDAAFACPFTTGGRVQFAMLAEWRHGVAQGLDDAIFVHLGKGIGLGILAGGRILQGASGFAGEIGSIVMDEMEPAPPGVGQFEWMAGGRAFARLARRAVEAGDSTALAALCEGDTERLDARMVFEAASAGDVAAGQIVDRLTGRLARGLAAACCMFNPAKLIVGAGLAHAGDAFVADLGARIAALVPFPVSVERTALLDRTSVSGAVEQATRLVEEEDFFLFAARDRKAA
ncbi:ROK family protein [Aureimonas altamirensis]|uniref:ROK family transcriptional regulator n=1 Tax=Aureimonas altamirensis TaxID=370622 RepID=UPI00203736C4|nr:ROK family transcriptional regulator [Aureimonas altamirensis]MCM2503656.1 ROK family protein [Aureimonas altamirensis]